MKAFVGITIAWLSFIGLFVLPSTFLKSGSKTLIYYQVYNQIEQHEMEGTTQNLDLFYLGGCNGLRLLMTFIDFFKMMTFIEFDRFLKTFIDFCIVCKYMYDFHRFLF